MPMLIRSFVLVMLLTGSLSWNPRAYAQPQLITAGSYDVDVDVRTGRIAEGTVEGLIKIYAANYVQINEKSAHEGGTLTVRWSPDGQWLASGGYDGVIRVWDTDLATVGAFLGNAGPVAELVWSPDSTYVAALSPERFQVWSLTDSDQPISSTWAQDEGAVWSPDQSYLVRVGFGGVIYVMNGRTFEIQSTLTTNESSITDVEWWADNSQFITGGTSGDIRLWTIDASGTPHMEETLRSVGQSIADLAVAPNRENIAVATSGGGIVVFDLRDDRIVRVEEVSTLVSRLTWSPDSRTITFAKYVVNLRATSSEALPLLSSLGIQHVSLASVDPVEPLPTVMPTPDPEVTPEIRAPTPAPEETAEPASHQP